MGKGSKPRPMKVKKEEYDKNWERAFQKKKKKNATYVRPHKGVDIR